MMYTYLISYLPLLKYKKNMKTCEEVSSHPRITSINMEEKISLNNLYKEVSELVKRKAQEFVEDEDVKKACDEVGKTEMEVCNVVILSFSLFK